MTAAQREAAFGQLTAAGLTPAAAAAAVGHMEACASDPAFAEPRLMRRTVYGRGPEPRGAVEISTPAEQRAEAEHAEAVRSRVVAHEERILAGLFGGRR